MQPDRPLVAAIPVRNEAERIGPCLLALARQHAARLTHVVVLLNNCTDATLQAVQAISGRLPLPFMWLNAPIRPRSPMPVPRGAQP
ncbi:hypothetical protein RI056_15310 [Komagataeibacter nataicola]|uniref:hypothetical protein n=1 Tax=Komagataeibacter nataicola TaxID=265960 RepID=UPI0028AC9A14|nr:hypothetical protein [Komagataeibacter nataicola]WNM08240.1 hypothetical protein RI056_15310 [Komagataeibacter nataicola]